MRLPRPFIAVVAAPAAGVCRCFSIIAHPFITLALVVVVVVVVVVVAFALVIVVSDHVVVVVVVDVVAVILLLLLLIAAFSFLIVAFPLLLISLLVCWFISFHESSRGHRCPCHCASHPFCLFAVCRRLETESETAALLSEF